MLRKAISLFKFENKVYAKGKGNHNKMGMSASQARLLTLTARQHDVEWKAQKLQAEKLRLANDSDNVYNTYLDALSATKIQARVYNTWENDTFEDATLAMLQKGFLKNPEGVYASNPLFLQETGANGTTRLLVTQAVANEYGLSEADRPYTGTIEEFFTEVARLDETNKTIVGRIDKGGSFEDDLNSVAAYQGVQNSKFMAFKTTIGGSGEPISNINPTLDACSTFKNEVHTVDTSAMTKIDSTTTTLTNGVNYVISDAEGLLKLKELCKSGTDTRGVNIYLDSDIESIDMSGITNWDGINNFNGTFNGNGKVINGLTGSQGLFNVLGFDSIVTNVGLTNINISGNSGAIGGLTIGGLAGTTSGDITNCYVTGNISSGSGNIGGKIGGLVGSASSGTSSSTTTEITDCNVNVNLTGGRNSTVGGLCGTTMATISGCSVWGEISGTGMLVVGGIIGSCNGTTKITDSKTGMYIKDSGSTTGLIAGTSESVGRNLLTFDTITYYGDPNNNNKLLIGDVDTSYRNRNVTKKRAPISSPSQADMSQLTLAALIKHGDIDAEDTSEVLRTLETVTKMVEECFSQGEEIIPTFCNDVIYDYLTDGNKYTDDEKTMFMEALVEDVSNGYYAQTIGANNKKLYNSFSDRYDWVGYNPIEDYESYTCIDIINGTLTIPSRDTMEQTLAAALMMLGSDEANANAQAANFFNKYDWNDTRDKAYIAKINDILCAYGTNATITNDMQNLYDCVTNNIRYEELPNSIENPEYYEISVANNSPAPTITYNKVYVPNYEPVLDWNYEDPKVQEALQKYTLRKIGIKIIDDTQANSATWLTNMINCGLAQFAYFDINSAIERQDNGKCKVNIEKMNVENTSVANETSLQEIEDSANIKKAEATYEADMRKINRKETKIDTQLSTLEAERSSIKTEKDTLKSVAKDNVDMTFKLFS